MRSSLPEAPHPDLGLASGFDGAAPIPYTTALRKLVREVDVDILIALLVGAVIGWLASLIMKTDAQMGLIANVIVGILGSGLGYWLAPKIGISTAGSVMSWVVAVGGAVLLILILKVLGIYK